MAGQTRYSSLPRSAAPIQASASPIDLARRFPMIRQINTTPWGTPIWNSKTPTAPWAEFHRALSGQPDPAAPPLPPDPNDPNRYKAMETIKSPEVAAQTNVLMDSFKQGAEAMTKGWTDFFNEAKAAQAVNKEAFTREQQNFNVQPLANDLRANNADFANTSREIGSRYASSDADYESAQRMLTERANAVLPEYDNAARAIADRQFSAAAGQVSRYKAGSGTPRSLGSSEIAMLNRAASDVYLPLHREQIARRMGLITDLEMPLEREYAGRDTARLADEYGREQYLSERNADTEKQIKQLEVAVAGMSRQQAESYLRSLGLPMQIAQEILSRHIANLGGLGQLEESSRYRGLQDTQGMPLTPAVNYSMGTGTYPTTRPNTYQPNVPQNQPGVVPGYNPGYAPGVVNQNPNPYAGYPLHIQRMLSQNANARYAPQPLPDANMGTGGGYIDGPDGRRYLGTDNLNLAPGY